MQSIQKVVLQPGDKIYIVDTAHLKIISITLTKNHLLKPTNPMSPSSDWEPIYTSTINGKKINAHLASPEIDPDSQPAFLHYTEFTGVGSMFQEDRKRIEQAVWSLRFFLKPELANYYLDTCIRDRAFNTRKAALEKKLRAKYNRLLDEELTTELQKLRRTVYVDESFNLDDYTISE